VEEDSIIAEDYVINESVALRIVLNELLNSHTDSISSKSYKLRNLCFEFEYPIELSYNDQVIVEVLDINGLIDVLENETSSMHITGISMPFIVHLDSDEKVTVSNEDDFFNLISTCSSIIIPVEDDFIENCMQFSYPIQVITIDDTIYTITSDDSFTSFSEAHWNEWNFEFVYPFSIIDDTDALLINNEYELFDLLYNCSDIGCDCYEDYAPVCVEVEEGEVIQFYNACEALCNGFSESDFVSCFDPSESIYNFEMVQGSCNENWTYDLSIDFDYTSTDAENFILMANTEYLGTFPLTSLPITIEFPVSEFYYDLLEIYLEGDSDDYFTSTWIPEYCEGAELDYSSHIGTCFDFIYPIDIYDNGFITMVNSRTEFFNHYNDETSTTSLSFPLDVVNLSTGETDTLLNMYGLNNYLESSCD